MRKLVSNGIGRLKPTVVPLNDDIIGDRFWKENPEVIGLKSLGTYQMPINNMNNIPTIPMQMPGAIHQPMPMKALPGNAMQNSPIGNCSAMNDPNKPDADREPNRNGDPK